MKLLVLLVATSAASPLEHLFDSKAVAVKDEEAGTNRAGKLYSVFQVAKFQNGACTTNDTKAPTGSCYLAEECSGLGGENGGACAERFGLSLGVCCKVVVKSCGLKLLTVSMNNSHIVNTGYPGELDLTETCESSEDTNADAKAPRLVHKSSKATLQKSYVYAINKASPTVEQIRIDFLDFNISKPINGSCKSDWLIIKGADPATMETLPKNLCGLLTGQHVYLSVKHVETVTIIIKVVSDGKQRWKDGKHGWNMLVRQFEARQKEYLAPRGCLQYYKEDAGSFSTFNNNGGAGELLNNYNYSVCIGENKAYGDVYLTASNFNLTQTNLTQQSGDTCGDGVTFGSSCYCGSTFPSHTWNFPGTYKIDLCSDGENSAPWKVAGFEINFLMMPR